ncbi:hypothetical protein SI65_06671 [Aspergillus cristatus]|uniref:Rhodopsin domain-containing protein n=1 Tax=Aspergillus cristatus TaxID=573508 RepID=A0A1E3BA66_ASPCR|nr:hypothetical protein SI65_06671 [Aspergillus cristatus]
MDGLESHTLFRREDASVARGNRALVVTAVLTALSIVVVSMRVYARAALIKMMGREDWAIVISLAFAIIYLGFVAGEVHFGLGAHSAKLSDEELMNQLKMLWVAIPMYNASLACTKFSILFQYLRIFPRRPFRISCYIVMGIVAFYSTWAFITGFLTCVPVAKFWDRTVKGYCFNFEALWFFNAAMNIATDFTLLIMPMPLLSQLQLPRTQRIALCGVFAIGGLVVITSALRLSSLHTVAKDPDTSYSNVAAAYWTAAECNVAIICASLPFLRPVISCIFPKLMPTNSYRRHRTGFTTTNRSRLQTELYSQQHDYDMYTIDVKSDAVPRDPFRGIEVTTEMIQETGKPSMSKSNVESTNTSQRELVMDA